MSEILPVPWHLRLSDEVVTWAVDDVVVARNDGWALNAMPNLARDTPYKYAYHIDRAGEGMSFWYISQPIGGVIMRRAVDGDPLCVKAIKFVEATRPALLRTYMRWMFKPDEEAL